MDEHIVGGSAQVFIENGKVGVTFAGPNETDPETGEEIPGSGIVEVTLDPETARNLAFNLTKASYAVEGDSL
jgi:hypothetical protein